MKPKRIYNKTEIVTRRYETYFYFHDDLHFTSKEIDTDDFTIASAKVDSNNFIQEYTKEKFDEISDYLIIKNRDIESEKINKLFSYFEQKGFEKSPKWYSNNAEIQAQRVRSLMEYSPETDKPYMMFPPNTWKYDKYGTFFGNTSLRGVSYETLSYGSERLEDGFHLTNTNMLVNPVRDSLIIGDNSLLLLRGAISPQAFQSLFFNKYPMTFYAYVKGGLRIPSKDIAKIILKNGDTYEI